jgi:hypothetical protein
VAGVVAEAEMVTETASAEIGTIARSSAARSAGAPVLAGGVPAVLARSVPDHGVSESAGTTDATDEAALDPDPGAGGHAGEVIGEMIETGTGEMPVMSVARPGTATAGLTGGNRQHIVHIFGCMQESINDAIMNDSIRKALQNVPFRLLCWV